jgi:hypothetical protein
MLTPEGSAWGEQPFIGEARGAGVRRLGAGFPGFGLQQTPPSYARTRL